MTDEGNCAFCGRPEIRRMSGSLTDWVLICDCQNLESVELPENCMHCGKPRVAQSGSLTGLVFRGFNCDCINADHSDGASPLERALELDEQCFPLNRFQPRAVLGTGSFGTVYLCADNLLIKDVAVKLLHRILPGDVIRLQREAQLLAGLQHKNLVTVLDLGLTDNSAPYMVMDYFNSESLEKRLSDGPMELSCALHLLGQVCRALTYIHEKKIFHRDLSTANILIEKREDSVINVKLIDFGLSYFQTSEEQGKTVVGSPYYMCPEMLRGQAYGASAEIYSLGALFFNVLTGRPVFEGNSAARIIYQHDKVEAPLVSQYRDDCPEPLVQLIARMLAKNPECRPASVEEVIKFLDLETIDDVSSEKTDKKVKVKKVPLVKVLAGLALSFLLAFCFILNQKFLNEKNEFDVDTVKTPMTTEFTEPFIVEDAVTSESLAKSASNFQRAYSSHLRSDVDLSRIGSEAGLEELDLRSSAVRDLPIPPSVRPRIRYLNAGLCDLTPKGLETVASLKNLEELHLDGILLSNGRLRLLNSLPKVSILSLVDCSLSSADLIALNQLSNLKVLDLHDNEKIKDEGVLHLLKNKALRTIVLRNTGITEKGVKSLKSNLPNCQIKDSANPIHPSSF